MTLNRSVSVAPSSQSSVDFGDAAIRVGRRAQVAQKHLDPKAQSQFGRVNFCGGINLDAERRANQPTSSAAPKLGATAGVDLAQVREEELFKRVRLEAQRLATKTFHQSPGAKPDHKLIRECLRKIGSRYADLPLNTLEEKILSEFYDAYRQKYDTLFGELSWVKRQYYRTKEWVCALPQNIFSQVAGFTRGIFKVGCATVSAASTVAEIGKEAACDTAKLVAKVAKTAKNATGKFISNCVREPVKTWQSIQTFAKDVSDSLGITDLAVGVLGSGRRVLGSFGQVLKTGGVLAQDFVRVIKGECTAGQLKENLKQNVNVAFSELGKALAEAQRVVKGALVMTGEVTGVIDVVYAAKYALEGRWGMVAMHAGFAVASAGSIAATVATGGAAAGSILGVMAGRTAMKITLKQATKQGFETLAKELGSKVVAEFGQEVGKQICKELGQEVTKESLHAGLQTALKQTGERIAKESLDGVVEQVRKHGAQALTSEAVQKTTAEAAEKVTETFLKKYGLSEIVEKQVYQTLKELSEKTPKKLAASLEDLGISQKQFKQMQQSLKHPKFDKELKQVFEDAIGKPLTKSLQDGMEKPFKDTFRAGLKGELEDESCQKLLKAMQEKGIKLTDGQIDDLVEAGWKGCKEGIEKAARKVVREGIERAFKQFRSPRIRSPRSHGDGFEGIDVSTLVETNEGLVLETPVSLVENKQVQEVAVQDLNREEIVRHEPMADGVTAIKTYVIKDGRLELAGVSFVGR
ncbi:MAG: hypothetical protein GX589_10200 [Deltaproteobacteria bacterium]|nr:hypothetical protein [Deltaproteobacteria bacterium]